ncbi:MAG TPA: hypothetical protein VHD37_02930 [Candidatus Paceibacterota bacterium]|nr:hypothetical protein [Candidatus Paceibacterota bacterium]
MHTASEDANKADVEKTLKEAQDGLPPGPPDGEGLPQLPRPDRTYDPYAFDARHPDGRGHKRSGSIR